MPKMAKQYKKMEKEHALVSFWKEVDEKAEETNLQESALALQRQAEIDVPSKKNAYLDAQTALRKAKIAAKDKPNFTSIVDASLALQIAETKYNKSLAVYIDMFGEEPKLLTFKTVSDAPKEETRV